MGGESPSFQLPEIAETVEPATRGATSAFVGIQDPFSGININDPYFTGVNIEPTAGQNQALRAGQGLMTNFLQTPDTLRSAIRLGGPIREAALQGFGAGQISPVEALSAASLQQEGLGTQASIYSSPVSNQQFREAFPTGVGQLGGGSGARFNLAGLDASQFSEIDQKMIEQFEKAKFRTGPPQSGRIQNLTDIGPYIPLNQAGPGTDLGLDLVRITPPPVNTGVKEVDWENENNARIARGEPPQTLSPGETIKDGFIFRQPESFNTSREQALALGTLGPQQGILGEVIKGSGGGTPVPPLIPSSPPGIGGLAGPTGDGPTVAGPTEDGGTVAGGTGDGGRGFLGTVDDLISPGGGPTVGGPTGDGGPLGANNGITEGPNGETILDPASGVDFPYFTGPNGEPILSAEAARTHGIQRDLYDSGDRAGIDNLANYPQNEFYNVSTFQQELIQAARHITNKPLFPPPPSDPPQRFTPVNEIPPDFNFTDPNAAHTFSLLPPENIQFYSNVRQRDFNGNDLYSQELINASRIQSGLPPLIDGTPDVPPLMQETPLTPTPPAPTPPAGFYANMQSLADDGYLRYNDATGGYFVENQAGYDALVSQKLVNPEIVDFLKRYEHGTGPFGGPG